MIKTVIFDLDDTLISEQEYIKSGYQAVSAWMAGKYVKKTQKEWSAILWNTYESGSKKVFNDVLSGCRIDYTQADINILVECYRKHIPDIEFYPDVCPCFKQLKEQGIGLGILSDGYKETQRNKCMVLKLYEMVDHVILTDELGRAFWKPCHLAYEKMKNYFQCKWDELIYVGDNPAKDFAIRAQYPIHTVQIDRIDKIYKACQYLDDILPEYKINNLKELSNIIYENM